MTADYAISLLVLVATTVYSKAADVSSLVHDDQSDPNYFDYYSENGVDDVQVCERLLRKKETATCLQLCLGDQRDEDHSAADQEIRTSDRNFKAYNKNEEEEQNINRRFDETLRRQLQSDINAPETRDIKSSPLDDFAGQRSILPLNSNDGGLNNCCNGQIKRRHFDGQRHQQSALSSEGNIKRNYFGGSGSQAARDPCEDDTEEDTTTLDNKCKGQMKRNNFDSSTTVAATPSNDNKGQMKRSKFAGFRSSQETTLSRPNARKPQMKRSKFDSSRSFLRGLRDIENEEMKRRPVDRGFRSSRSNKESYGDTGMAQTEGSQTYRNLPQSQMSDFYDTENEQRQQSRETDSDQVKIQVKDYNSDELLMREKYAEGKEIEQNINDLPQHFQPELNGSPSNLDLNPLSDFDADYGIPPEKIHEVRSDSAHEKKSEAEETSSDDLLALLVNLVREKRQKEESPRLN